MPDHFWLAEMTWPEFKAALPGLSVALVPLGATEQHGPGGTFAVDTARAEAFVRALARRMHPQAVAVPAFPYSLSLDQMAFPGTITLSAGTLIQVLEQVAVSLYSHGLKKVFYITAHAGAGPALNIVLANLKGRRPDLKVGWTDLSGLAPDLRSQYVDGHGGHGDEGELSECLYLAPEAVRTAALVPGDPVPAPPAPSPIRVAQSFADRSRNGALGNPVCASRELGQTLVDTALERLEAFLTTQF